MTEWSLVYDGYDPREEGKRETLCALGNGYFVSRGAATNAVADGIHYPATYLAGGYNRLTTEIAGQSVENEDLVNIPNWLPVVMRIADGPWLRPQAVAISDYRQELDLQRGVLSRSLRMKDESGRTTRWEERRIVSMAAPHLAALQIKITAEDWSDAMTVRSALDGDVTNAGVPRYRDLASRHLETVAAEKAADAETIFLRSRMIQCRREIAMAARTRITGGTAADPPARRCIVEPDRVADEITVSLAAGDNVTVEKTVALYTSRDMAISEPGMAALEQLARAGSFAELLAQHARAWGHLWDDFDIAIKSQADGDVQMKLRLHLFHLLQTVSGHSIDLDVGMPPRGWHGEAYRGHIMWDELFIFPYLNLRKPALTRALLRYRYRRLNRARLAAQDAGFRGAMFPWMSGSDGREEVQRFHLNPMSGRWIPDNSHRQRHINAAIAVNIWQYFDVTDDREFLYEFGAELLLELARFWASMATYDAATDRYAICGVMGPDEFHTAYPGRDPSTEGGLDNNAYTNVMASWSITRALDALDRLPDNRRALLVDVLDINDEELALWDDVSRKLTVPFHDDGVISQFEGYETLKEFDWAGYAKKYGNAQRLDRILDAEGKDPNEYKLAKQADVLMLFFIFSTEELTEIFERLGYDFSPETILKTIRFYVQRTSDGSTLSTGTNAWVMARADRRRSWDLFRQALDSDFADVQGGTTREGIHLGAMAGTVDLIQRCYTGVELRANALTFNPRFPDELIRLRTTVRYRGQTLDLDVSHERLTVSSRPFTADPVTIAYRGQVREISPGQTYVFRLIPPRGDT